MTLQDDLNDLAALKAKSKEIAEEYLALETRIIVALEKKGQKTVSAGDVQGTLVKGSTITIDQEALKKSLGATVWKKVTVPVLDKERLEAEITVGNIDANVVAQCSTEKDRKPFIKISGNLPATTPVQPKPAAKKRVVVRKKTA